MNILHRIEKCIDTFMAFFPRHRPDAKTISDICLVAHRGAHDNTGLLQENTLAAFEQALNLNCYGIELDVQTTADGVLVVNHDANLKRLWGHEVTINALSFQELRGLVPSLPSLAEVITLYGKRMHLFIELKAPFIATHALAETLQTLTPCADYHLLSLDETVLPSLHLFPKASLLLVPVHNNVKKFCTLSLQEQYGGILGHYLLLSNRKIKSLLTANQLAGVGFVDSKFSLYRELNRGLNLFFTDNATRVATCIKEFRM